MNAGGGVPNRHVETCCMTGVRTTAAQDLPNHVRHEHPYEGHRDALHVDPLSHPQEGRQERSLDERQGRPHDARREGRHEVPRHEAGGHVHKFEHSRPRMEQTSRAANAHELAILRPKAVGAACT